VLFGKIRPYFHKVVFAPFEGVSSSDAIVIRSRDPEQIGFILCVVSSDLFVAQATSTSNGTKMPRANWSVLARYPVLIGPDDLMKRFNLAVASWAELAASLNQANIRLAASRDHLLPRLMSGDVSLSTAERELEAVA
jgi:type I restriction enzyme S subunit